VPVIFLPEDADWNRVGAGTYDIPNSCTGALTGDMVNMLVVNNHCIIPEARGPLTAAGVDLFQRDLGNKLTALGLTTHFIDCWQPYHEHHGEIHCGTNTWRKPANIGTWLGTAPARWWEFDG
jgi:protein-arginine deiminase